MKQQWQPE
jgi:hypothetical protein